MADRIVDEGLLARRRPAAAAKGKLPHTHGAGAGSEGEPRANSATPGVAALPAPVDAGELSDETESDAEEGGWVSREPAASTRGPSQVRRSAAGSGGRAGASDRGSSQRRQDRPPSNREIRVPQVRVVDATGANLGIMSPSKGIEIAKGQGLDLVMVSAAATPPVCKIAPLHKVVAALKAAESERRRAESSRKTKEMRFTARISEHDLDVKAAKVVGFLKEGRQVHTAVTFTLSSWLQEEPSRREVLARLCRLVAEAGVGFCDVSSIKGDGASLSAQFNPSSTPRPAAELERVLARLAVPITPGAATDERLLKIQATAAAALAGVASQATIDAALPPPSVLRSFRTRRSVKSNPGDEEDKRDVSDMARMAMDAVGEDPEGAAHSMPVGGFKAKGRKKPVKR